MTLPRLVRFLVCSTGLLSAVAGMAQTRRQHGAHVHGITTIQIAQNNRDLFVSFEMPGINAVGFERAPRSHAEESALDTALQTLRAPTDWVTPNAEALCHVSWVEVKPDGFIAHDPVSPSDSTAHSADAEHADIDVHVGFECDAPLNLRSMTLRLIEHFPGTHEIRVQLAMPGGQSEQVFSTPVADITFAPAPLED